MNYEEFFENLRNEGSDLMMRAFGLTNVDYSPSSLDEMEKLLNRIYPEGHQPLPTTLIPFGFYLGETIVRNIPGAKWDLEEEPENIFDMTISIEGPNSFNSKVSPFIRIAKFWGDRTDGIMVFYDMISLMATGALKVDNMESGQWVTFPNGHKMRVTKMEKAE